MKRTLFSLAVLGVTSATFAQSSVTLFGVVDATLAVGRGSIANRTQLTHSGYSQSRIGFRGTEDLGGGMSASFWLEAGVSNDNGNGISTNLNNQASGGAAAGTQGLTFNRRSTVSLASKAGELRIGRDYVPQFWNLALFDPLGVNGVGASQPFMSVAFTRITAVRASNSIGYFLPPNLGGLYGQFQTYMGENPSNSGPTKDDGKGHGLRLGYASGPVNIALGWGKTEYAAGDWKQGNLGAWYDFGVAKLMGQISRDEAGAVGSSGWVVGGLIPVGPGEIRLAYSQYATDTVAGPEAKSRKHALGYVHNLSKRTALYTSYARVRNSGGTASALNGAITGANASSSGFDLGIRHNF